MADNTDRYIRSIVQSETCSDISKVDNDNGFRTISLRDVKTPRVDGLTAKDIDLFGLDQFKYDSVDDLLGNDVAPEVKELAQLAVDIYPLAVRGRADSDYGSEGVVEPALLLNDKGIYHVVGSVAFEDRDTLELLTSYFDMDARALWEPGIKGLGDIWIERIRDRGNAIQFYGRTDYNAVPGFAQLFLGQIPK